ncbi:hypothetical protein [Pseudoduganella armeniaca]|uniref:Uncharacterized protein n=1 Tax=Pseudoduganella armeniaca TaxID=2072590 RepID=A0A2R4C7A9_9BURK|nr:hypothetical protein [Pseudoduganella armeniaca]AVR95533.1 hypothetical protein C9I28_07180 [Pseudoduganella armeniaca]
MNDVSLFRMNLLRAVYLLIGVGLAVNVWPQLAGAPVELMQGVVNCMLAVVGLLAFVGVRYPLRMLPLLLWEMLWKALWVLLVALPAWRAGTMDDGIAATLFACAVGMVVPLALPWGYVWRRYVTGEGEPWRRHAVQ